MKMKQGKSPLSILSTRKPLENDARPRGAGEFGWEPQILALMADCLKTLGCFLALAAAAHAETAPTRVEVTRDVWISSYPSEREGNNGGSPKLKLKGHQEFFLTDFDPASLRGKRVRR